MNKKAFTLVELIVVITILAILGTIAFISLQGYNTYARDTTRISDIGTMKKALSLFKIENGYYPEPSTPSSQVSFSGSEVWTQGVFSESVTRELRRMSNVPKDPLTNSEYTYSLLNTNIEYEIGTLLEGGLSLNVASDTYAAGNNIGTAYVTGDYNGKVAKVSTGTTSYILAVPTIISSDLTNTSYTSIVSNNLLAYHGGSNLPSTFADSNYNNTAGSGTTIVKDVLIYTDTNNLSNLSNDAAARDTMMANLKNSYTGSVLADNSTVGAIFEGSSSDEVFASHMINDSLGGNAPVASTTGNNPGGGTGGGVTGSGCVFGSSTFGNCVFQ